MLGTDNIKKYSRAKEEMDLLNRQFFSFSKTHKFEQAKTRGVKGAAPEKQLFYNEMLALKDSFLIERGFRSVSDSKGASEKQSIMNLIVSALPQLDSVEDFRVLSQSKMKCAIRTTSGDYELAFTAHKSPVVEVKQGIEVVGKLNPHVEELSNLLTNGDHGVVRIKNNQITFAREDGSQLSLKITKKKKELF